MHRSSFPKVCSLAKSCLTTYEQMQSWICFWQVLSFVSCKYIYILTCDHICKQWETQFCLLFAGWHWLHEIWRLTWRHGWQRLMRCLGGHVRTRLGLRSLTADRSALTVTDLMQMSATICYIIVSCTFIIYHITSYNYMILYVYFYHWPFSGAHLLSVKLCEHEN